MKHLVLRILYLHSEAFGVSGYAMCMDLHIITIVIATVMISLIIIILILVKGPAFYDRRVVLNLINSPNPNTISGAIQPTRLHLTNP